MVTTKRILVVDDDLSILEVVEAALLWLGGWRVLKCQSAKDGLHLARKEELDLIVLDVMMPDIDGFSFLGILRSDPGTAEIPVILLTGYLCLPDQQTLREKGVIHTIPKPFQPVDLVERIADAMKWW